MTTRLDAAPRFYRAHGLGNDYLVFDAVDPDAGGWEVTPGTVRRICDRWEGLGADGIVVLQERAPEDDIFPLRMFNPDGSEFERSGNGLRILASYLHREGLVGEAPFRVRSGGSVIPMVVNGVDRSGGYDVSVDMGRAVTGPDAVKLDREALDGEGRIRHPSLGAIDLVTVSVGNPHAVVFPPGATDELLGQLGPFLATHSGFAEGTNVQLVERVEPDHIRIKIWERGVGRTSASGTSSCAAAVAAVSTGRIEPGWITVSMDGGRLRVSVDPDLEVALRGPVVEVAEGRLLEGFLRSVRA